MDLYLGGHMQFGSLQGHHIIQSTEDQDGYNDGKICYQGATLGEKQKQPEASWGESGKYNMDEDKENGLHTVCTREYRRRCVQLDIHGKYM